MALSVKVCVCVCVVKCVQLSCGVWDWAMGVFRGVAVNEDNSRDEMA